MSLNGAWVAVWRQRPFGTEEHGHRGMRRMAALVIVEIAITDPVAYEDYKKLAAGTVHAYGGRYLARGGAVELLEGEWHPARVVVLEFPSTQRAKEWWNSEAYQPAKKLRHASARTDMILIEGV